MDCNATTAKILSTAVLGALRKAFLTFRCETAPKVQKHLQQADYHTIETPSPQQ